MGWDGVGGMHRRQLHPMSWHGSLSPFGAPFLPLGAKCRLWLPRFGLPMRSPGSRFIGKELTAPLRLRFALQHSKGAPVRNEAGLCSR